jgi:hypothetical protein
MLEKTFRALADEWRQETGHLSSPTQIAMHKNYQRIIAAGPAALPYILRDLRDHGGQWYLALRAITRQSPVTPEMAGKSKEVRQAWLNWGREQGLIE